MYLEDVEAMQEHARIVGDAVCEMEDMIEGQETQTVMVRVIEQRVTDVKEALSGLVILLTQAQHEAERA